jgi:saccharopine dehydrogenase (NAD+, L-lysine-forming)
MGTLAVLAVGGSGIHLLIQNIVQEEQKMSKVLIIGAGGVANVVAKKCAQNQADFSELLIATRTRSRADKIASEIKNIPVHTAKVDADQPSEVAAIIRDFKPKLVMNIALPYQDLAIMDACLETGVDYLDTANYEPKDVAKFEYSWQWAYQERFQKAGLMALLGSGFDPGQTNVYTAWLKKHHFDRMDTLDIVDCNNGDHGKAFATNFNPEINIREITQPGRFWENGAWHEIPALSLKADIDYPEVGHPGIVRAVPRRTGIPGEELPRAPAGALLDDLRRQLHQAPHRAAERGHDKN